ncbi:hypothetical protein BN159_0455 [Streptomyces davaonensis JCM 4913]|uniref:Uncharacterized protein n=1 Tax=Streptomyces davaonensis (strain DSM 101723 / JCM 4913 / KCC S-0913 / 768) TaxID=1214101 RepID=K4QWU9_STRDJ|nr:hypothetical protein BN159_0455 [Streptomyces davaonensis JCM 4913]
MWAGVGRAARQYCGALGKRGYCQVAAGVPVISHITKVPVGPVMLDNAGHYPLEDPGLQQLENAIDDFVTKHTS